MFSFSYKYRFGKKFRQGLTFSGGRNFTGKITLLHHSGPKVRWNYCFVDNYRIKRSSHIIIRFDFASFYNCYLALVYDFRFGLGYHKMISGLRISQIITDNVNGRFGIGSSIPLQFLSSGQVVSNVSSGAYSICKFGRSPGSKVVLVSFEDDCILGKLPSGSVRRFTLNSRGLLGPSFSNLYQTLQSTFKAGFNVYRGTKPSVRGVAKNPVDHPHGGGEGRKSPPASARSPWGWLTR